MSLNALATDGGWGKEYAVDSQAYVSADELFFAAPDYEDIRVCEDPDVHEYWESGLSIESLDALRLGRGDYASSTCYHCKHKGHLKANCPDRRLAERKPWERAWKSRKRRRSHNAGGGASRNPAEEETEKQRPYKIL